MHICMYALRTYLNNELITNHYLVKYLESNISIPSAQSSCDLLALLSKRWNQSIRQFDGRRIVTSVSLLLKLISSGVSNHFAHCISKFLSPHPITTRICYRRDPIKWVQGKLRGTLRLFSISNSVSYFHKRSAFFKFLSYPLIYRCQQ